MFKTTIVIWSEWDPTDKLELPELAHEATFGDMYCSVMDIECVPDSNLDGDPDWDGTEFFSEYVSEGDETILEEDEDR